MVGVLNPFIYDNNLKFKRVSDGDLNPNSQAFGANLSQVTIGFAGSGNAIAPS